MRRLLPFALVSLLASCASPGACDPDDSHFDLVYDSQGVPAFAGQAMIIESCGYGNYCHSGPEVTGANRIGAPVGLDFDLRVASVGIEEEPLATERLDQNQVRMIGMRDSVWSQVSTGNMPPPGNQYRDLLTAGGSDPERHAYVASDGARTPLPDIASAEGRELVRNFLACAGPVVERVVAHPNAIQFTVPLCEQNCADVTWPSLQENLLLRSCAFGDCHDSTDPPVGLDFTGPAAEVASRLINMTRPPEIVGGQCGARSDSYIVPGDVDGSFLYEKVSVATSDDTCGSVMPLRGNRLTEQRLCALRSWIECGACPEADGGACAACLEGARAACNVPDGGSTTGECRTQTVCPPRL